ncbi:MAG: type IV secretory system conjugative DNA transfer family protein [Planctomycetes bacterium]|nr:type IV secretory system conjugative DNA transfer family protein [Planctomycetota bacterium]
MPAAPQSRAQEGTFRPPAVSLLYSGVWSFATHELYFLGQGGWEWGTLAAFATGGMAIGQLAKAVGDRFKVKALRRRVKRFKAGTKKHGQSRFATLEDIENAKSLSDQQGVFFGSFSTGRRSSVDVFGAGDVNVSVIAPPGANKTMSIVVPTLLADLGHSFICNDPASEALSICRAALESMKYKIVLISPFAHQVKELTGFTDIQDVGLDMFASLHPDMPRSQIREELKAIFKRVIPDVPNMDADAKFFFRGARNLCIYFAIRDIINGRKPSLVSIRRQLMLGPVYLSETFSEDEDSTEFGGLLAEMAQSFGGVLQAAGPQFSGSYGVAEEHLELFDEQSSMGQHTSRPGIDPGCLKDPNQKIACFVSYPLQYLDSHAVQLAMTLTHLFDMVAADPQLGQCTAIIDECGALNMPKLADSLNFYRKAGLRCVMIWQDLAGQAEKNYGKAVVRQIMGASQIKVVMGLQEPETLELFSKLCGTQAIDDMSLNDRANMADAMPDLAPGLNHRDVPLIRPEDIRTMSHDQMLVIAENAPPLILTKVPYWTRKAWLKIAGRSPYYRG